MREVVSLETEVTTNSSFLLFASKTITNLHVDANGIATLPKNETAELLAKYGVLEVILVGDQSQVGDADDGEEVSMRSFYLPQAAGK